MSVFYTNMYKIYCTNIFIVRFGKLIKSVNTTNRIFKRVEDLDRYKLLFACSAIKS